MLVAANRCWKRLLPTSGSSSNFPSPFTCSDDLTSSYFLFSRLTLLLELPDLKCPQSVPLCSVLRDHVTRGIALSQNFAKSHLAFLFHPSQPNEILNLFQKLLRMCYAYW